MPIINDTTVDPNTIEEIIYPWARQYWKDGIANNWVPEEIEMAEDRNQWNSPTFLSEAEKKLIRYNIGFFSTAELLTANNLIAIFEHVTNTECKQYLCRQIFEEAVHADTFIYCCEELGLDSKEVWNMYLTDPLIKKKDDFVVGLTKFISQPNFTTEGDENIRHFLHDLIGYYVIMEGIFFYAGFAMMLALKRTKRKWLDGKEKNIMEGVGQQFEYIMRDESLHLAFGCDLINTIKKENPQVWTKELEQEVTELIKQAVILEKEYAIEACPEGIVGINSQQFCEYVEYIADRRLDRIGLAKIYGTKNPFNWMSTAADLNKEKNFFETRVTEYQIGGRLEWDEEDNKKD